MDESIYDVFSRILTAILNLTYRSPEIQLTHARITLEMTFKNQIGS